MHSVHREASKMVLIELPKTDKCPGAVEPSGRLSHGSVLWGFPLTSCLPEEIMEPTNT